jgi:hypothetical protein
LVWMAHLVPQKHFRWVFTGNHQLHAGIYRGYNELSVLIFVKPEEVSVVISANYPGRNLPALNFVQKFGHDREKREVR